MNDFYAGSPEQFCPKLICICIWVFFETRAKMMCPRNSSLSILDPTRFHLDGLHQEHCLSGGTLKTAVSYISSCYALMHHYTIT